MNIEYALILVMLSITNFLLWKLYTVKRQQVKDNQAERLDQLMRQYTRNESNYEYD